MVSTAKPKADPPREKTSGGELAPSVGRRKRPLLLAATGLLLAAWLMFLVYLALLR